MRNVTQFRIVSIPCANCDGSGLLPGNDHRGLPKTCKACQGEGYFTERRPVELVTAVLRNAA